MRTILLIMLLTVSGFADSNACEQIELLKTRLSLHGSNLANLKTTRTPNGGPYKKLVIKECSNGSCQIVQDESNKLTYQPGHPDANHDGYVTYPNIDGKLELISFQAAFLELVGRARTEDCRTKVKGSDGASLIEYSLGEVKSDFFVKSPDGSQIWNRTFSNGTYQNTVLNEHL